MNREQGVSKVFQLTWPELIKFPTIMNNMENAFIVHLLISASCDIVKLKV